MIDFSLYLKHPRDASMSSNGEASNTINVSSTSAALGISDGDMNTVLDQKNYLEELNRHLK